MRSHAACQARSRCQRGSGCAQIWRKQSKVSATRFACSFLLQLDCCFFALHDLGTALNMLVRPVMVSREERFSPQLEQRLTVVPDVPWERPHRRNNDVRSECAMGNTNTNVTNTTLSPHAVDTRFRFSFSRGQCGNKSCSYHLQCVYSVDLWMTFKMTLRR